MQDQQPWTGMPSTRFQGSKKKLLPNLHSVFSDLQFNSCLDAFGGTGSVTFLLNRMGKTVTYNDILPSNQVMAKALFSTDAVEIDEQIFENLFRSEPGESYKKIIQENYRGIYFTQEENQQIDLYCQNVQRLSSEGSKNEAYYILFQSLLSKRPFNLFHRANLGMRTKKVQRSFGNKTTWDRTIIDHGLKFLKELRFCRSFAGVGSVNFSNQSAFVIRDTFDLVYIDTPYAKSNGIQESNYFNFYHFLDALLSYDNIAETIQTGLKHKPFYEINKSWYPSKNIDDAFFDLFDRFKNSQLVISYRSDGFPTVNRLTEMLKTTHREIRVVDIGPYNYVLSTRKTDTKEIVIIAKV